MDETYKGGFTAPKLDEVEETAAKASKTEGAADIPKNTGKVTKETAVKKSVNKDVRNIKVVATDRGWFDNRRIVPGTKLTVSEREFSELWMEKI